LTTEAFFCETVGEKKWAAALRRDPTVISLAPYELFPAALRECFLDTLLFAGRQEKGVALNLLHDIFPVPLAMETTQRVLEDYPLSKSDFRQLTTPPNSSRWTG
jgi:hypothetical protein